MKHHDNSMVSDSSVVCTWYAFIDFFVLRKHKVLEMGRQRGKLESRTSNDLIVPIL